MYNQTDTSESAAKGFSCILNCDRSLCNDNFETCGVYDTFPCDIVRAGFSVLHLNAGTGGLRKLNIVTLLQDFLLGEGSGVDVVVVGETWLKSDEVGCSVIPGFEFVSATRQTTQQGGGVGVFVRSGCAVISVVGVSSEGGHVQALRVHLKISDFEGHIIGVYSSNRIHEADMLDLLEGIIPNGCALP